MAPVFDSSQCDGPNCGKLRKDGHKLLVCGRCGASKYCSKKCQAEHWKNHKPVCKMNERNRRNPDPSVQELTDLVTAWLKVHRPAIGNALIDSLDIPRNPTAIREKVLFIAVERDPNSGHDLASEVARGRGFIVKQVELEDRLMLSMLGETVRPYWKDYLDQWDREHEQARNTGFWAAGLAMLRVEPDAYLRMLPFSFGYEAVMEPRDALWETELRKRIDEGLGPPEFLRTHKKKN